MKLTMYYPLIMVLLAEFGDHDPERHTLQYLKEFALVPKVILNFIKPAYFDNESTSFLSVCSI